MSNIGQDANRIVADAKAAGLNIWQKYWWVSPIVAFIIGLALGTKL